MATSRLAKTRNEYEEMEEKIAYMRQRVQQVRELMETKQSSEVGSGSKVSEVYLLMSRTVSYNGGHPA